MSVLGRACTSACFALALGFSTARPVAAAPARPECAVGDLPGLGTQYARAVRESRAFRDWHGPQTGADLGVLAAGPAADFWRVTRVILGPAGDALVAAGDVTPFQPVGPPSAPWPAVRPRGAGARRAGLVDGPRWL